MMETIVLAPIPELVEFIKHHLEALAIFLFVCLTAHFVPEVMDAIKLRWTVLLAQNIARRQDAMTSALRDRMQTLCCRWMTGLKPDSIHQARLVVEWIDRWQLQYGLVRASASWIKVGTTVTVSPPTTKELQTFLRSFGLMAMAALSLPLLSDQIPTLATRDSTVVLRVDGDEIRSALDHWTFELKSCPEVRARAGIAGPLTTEEITRLCELHRSGQLRAMTAQAQDNVTWFFIAIMIGLMMGMLDRYHWFRRFFAARRLYSQLHDMPNDTQRLIGRPDNAWIQGGWRGTD